MERLTIKELAPYLPYGLKAQHTTYFDNRESKTIVVDVESLHNECVTFSDGMDYYFDDQIDNECSIKPLLRPLSSITEEIEHNSISIQLEPNLEKIIPSEFIYKHWFYTIREDGHFSYHIGDGTVIGSLYRGVPYSLIEILLEWHFDVFGLIDRGLALPIEGKEVKP